jgi:hypothetical protein
MKTWYLPIWVILSPTNITRSPSWKTRSAGLPLLHPLAARLASVEEHLLWCQGCLDRLQGTEKYIEAMRRAAVRNLFDKEF